MNELKPTETGGPAFPVDEAHSNYEGMTLRDYFAAKAMQGFLSCPGMRASVKYYAEKAYKQADAMLEARK